MTIVHTPIQQDPARSTEARFQGASWRQLYPSARGRSLATQLSLNLPPVSVLLGGAAFGGALRVSGFVADVAQDPRLRGNWREPLARALRSPAPVAAFAMSRSALFGIASATKQACLSHPGGGQEIPGTGGLVPAVAVTGIAFGAAGAVADCFLNASPRSRAPGGRQLLRDALPLIVCYISFDYAERHLPEPLASIPFVWGGLGGVAAAATTLAVRMQTPTDPSPRGLLSLCRGFGLSTVARPFFVLGSALQASDAVEASVRQRWSP